MIQILAMVTILINNVLKEHEEMKEEFKGSIRPIDLARVFLVAKISNCKVFCSYVKVYQRF